MQFMLTANADNENSSLTINVFVVGNYLFDNNNSDNKNFYIKKKIEHICKKSKV